MRTAVVQFASATNKQANVDAITQLVAEAARSEPDLVVLPEASMFDFGRPDTPLASEAEPLDGRYVSVLAGLARSHRTAIVAGIFESTDDPDRAFNTLVAVDADGALRAAYRKVHLYDSFGYRESDRLLAADPVPAVFEVAGLPIGLMTCYDLRFPEMSRWLVDAGAQVLCVPAAWVRGALKEDHWMTLLRARAIENTCWVVAAAQCGGSYCGRSSIIDPMGIVVAGLGESPGSVVAEVTAERLAEARERNPALQHRRFRIIAQ